MLDKARGILQELLAQQDLAAYEQVLWDYFQLLKRWNKAYSLIATADDETLIGRHLSDSLAVRRLIKGKHCLDVGTGAGLPGLPLAVTMPGTEWVLLDANGKKIRFCEQAIHELGLDRVKAIQHRVETYQPETLFDTIISRAYDQADNFVRQTRHLVNEGGQLLAMKGRINKEERESAANQGLDLVIEPLNVPMLKGQRHAMIFTK